jgi:hypothetical protein
MSYYLSFFRKYRASRVRERELERIESRYTDVEGAWLYKVFDSQCSKSMSGFSFECIPGEL